MVRVRSVCAVLGSAACAAGVTALAGGQPTIQEEMDMEAGMEAWRAASTPGPHHEAMASQIGTWDITMRMWMDPAAEPTVSDGTAEVSWLIEGVWLQERLESRMMGRAYVGFGIFGYDNYKRQYVSSWVSNMSTAISAMRGSLSSDRKTMTMFGTMDEPITGEIGKTVKYVTEKIDEDNFILRVQEVQYGAPFTVLEIEYERRE